MARGRCRPRRLRRPRGHRLRGVHVEHHLDELTDLDRLPAPWGSHLVELIEARKAGHHHRRYSALPGLPQPDTGGLGHRARRRRHAHRADVWCAAKHQRHVAAVLADLDRDILEELADQRDQCEGRPDMSEAHSEAHLVSALRVAPAGDPTAIRWVRPSVDSTRPARPLPDTAGSAADALIVSAVGYGRHGYHAHRLSLNLVCAMQAAATANDVSLAAVGDWIDHDHGLEGHVDSTTLPARFAAAYLGRYASAIDYARRWPPRGLRRRRRQLERHSVVRPRRRTDVTEAEHLATTDAIGHSF